MKGRDMEMAVLEDMVRDKVDRDWGREMDMVVDNKKTIGPSYRTESSGHCCNQLVLPCCSRSRCVAMTVAPLDSGAA